MGNTCCSGKDCMGPEIASQVDIYQNNMGGRNVNQSHGGSQRKPPVQESVSGATNY